MVIEEEFLQDVQASLPELPGEKKHRFMQQFALSSYDADVLTASRELSDYFETVVKAANGEAKLSANWVIGELTGALNKAGLDITESPLTAQMLGGMITRIQDNTISGKIAKEVFEAMWQGEGDADAVIEVRGLKQITDSSAIEPIIDEIIANNPGQVEQYRSGKDKLFGFFVGQVMKVTQGKANPQQVNDLLKQKLDG